MLENTGIPTIEDLNEVFPSEDRLKKGPVVIIECFQRIPCNPCYTACNYNAIKEFEDINELPNVDHELCNGCGLCVSNCPGLAIMILDMTYKEDKALIKLPYEFFPLPKENEMVITLDREGKVVAEGKVIRVLNNKKLDKTPIISIEVDKNHAKRVRHFRLKVSDDIFYRDEIICRCSDITLFDIRNLIKQGHDSIDEIKKITRAGMGACQGKTCTQLIMREIANIRNIPISEIKPGKQRPTTKSIELEKIIKSIE